MLMARQGIDLHILCANACSVYENSSPFTAQKTHTIHQVTTMLSTSDNVLFLGHNHLLTTGADDLTL